jgi:hypothetical protein
VSAELDRVHRYREAARLAVRSEDHSLHARYLALVDLVEAARDEPDPLVRTWAERAIWTESKSFLGVDDERPSPPTEQFELAQRRLRDRGYSSCPTCKTPLANEYDFGVWRRMRADRISELERREGAVD